VKHFGVIGGIAADLEGRPFRPLILGDSNPGRAAVSFGGVGRNIAENLHRMGGNRVSFFSAVGKDALGMEAVDALADAGVDSSGILVLEEYSTALYLSILNERGDMALALSDMSILEQISPERIHTFLPTLTEASVLVLDANLTAEALTYCGRVCKDCRIFIDPVSVEKSERVRGILSACYALKPNRAEAEALAGFPIRSDEDLRAAGTFFLQKGLQMIFISLGEEGLFFMDPTHSGRLSPLRRETMVSATGAGDAASAAIADGIARNLEVESIAELAILAGSLTVRVQERVNRKIGSSWKR